MPLFKRERKIPTPLFSLVILLFKETATTSKPYFCGRDVVGPLFLCRPPFSLQKLVSVMIRLQTGLRGLWGVEGKVFNMAVSL